MTPRRRKADRCIALKIMDKIEPYDRISLVLMAAGALIFTAAWYTTMNAVAEETHTNSDDIDTLKQRINQMDGKLDVILRYVRK